MAEVRQYRSSLADLNVIAQRDLLALWRLADLSSADATRDLLVEYLPDLLTEHYLSAATVAADWYDLMRDAAEVPKSFTAVIPDPPDVGRGVSLAQWAVGPLYSATPAPVVALTKLSGDFQRAVQNGARNAVTTSSAMDPVRARWRRVGTGRCDFCRMLIGRGAVYGRESSDFRSHDSCGCVAVPDFG